ncbi:MAG: exopolysaccharide biosynthesis polyprenyl glycosylphosphotransferase [Gemmatimonadaceae bacterium]
MAGDALALVATVGLAATAAGVLPADAALVAALALSRLPLLLALALLTISVTGAYRPPVRGDSSAGALLGGAIVGLAPLIGWTPADGVTSPRLSVVVVAVILAWSALMLVRRLSSVVVDRVWPGRRGLATTLVVGTRAEYRTLLDQLDRGPWREHRVVGWVALGARRGADALGGLPSLPSLLDEHEVETVVVAPGLREDRLRRVREACRGAGCELLYPAAAAPLGDVIQPRVVWRSERPYFALAAPVLQPSALVMKRVADVAGSVVLLVLLSPLLLCLAVLIRLDSPGPVLFVQHRAGFGGRRFRMLKFRTMNRDADAEKEGLAHLNCSGDPRLFKIPDDPRVTRFGGWLRRWSLDELPQLWNVLVGDMSLVGPRPFFERDLAAYEDHHFLRLGAKPGITGLWQVSGRSAIVVFEEVVQLDREYIEQWSPWLDMRIIWRTIPAVLGRTGAY